MVRMSRLAHGVPSMGGALPLRPSDYPVAHPDDPTGAGLARAAEVPGTRHAPPVAWPSRVDPELDGRHQVSGFMALPEIQLRTDSIAGYFISGNVTHGWSGDPVKPAASCRRPRPPRHREGSPKKSGCGMHEK